MSPASRLPSLALLALAFVIGVACSDSAPQAGLSVQLAWQSARLTSGHQIHVVQQHLACAQCHEMRGESLVAASPVRCAACHAKESAIVHGEAEAALRFGAGVKADCTTCHAFGGAAVDLAADAGLDGGIPHAQFTPGQCIRCHATKQGDTPAVVVHATSDCLSCHRPHEDATPQPAPCAECHKDIATSHAARGKSEQQVCTTCHEHQHAPASEALGTCVSCHANHEPIVPASALFAGGHTACTTCHKPHDFAKQAALPCRSCHAEIHVLAETTVLAHQQCTSCHSPHDVKASPEKACATCHANVHPDHPVLGAKGTCTGCHEPHPPASQALDSTRSCSSCHQNAHKDSDFHDGVTCSQCHQPHAFKLALTNTSLCRNCHAQELARVALRTGHRVCSGCHTGLPHKPASPLGACVTCHSPEAHAVNRGHAQCTNCHEPHSGAQAAPCQSCHQEEARTAPAGHAKCVNCHEPHTGSTSRAPACATCHAVEASSKHGELAGGCANCHRPHGPKGLASPPVCTTCHQIPTLSGLHQISKHQQCASCHSGHGDQPNLARDACLSCHADRTEHFPGARCASCHLFDTPARK